MRNDVLSPTAIIVKMKVLLYMISCGVSSSDGVTYQEGRESWATPGISGQMSPTPQLDLSISSSPFW
jgi:hypothetical protein